ncbi:MAG: phosphate signaling complex protein PhoU [Rhodospirillaceae bacterium]
MPPFGTPHTVRAFDAELNTLNQKIARMGGLAETQLSNAVLALTTTNPALANQVIAGDDAVDTTEDSVNELVVRMLALRQPMADDLRVVMSSLKVAGALERVADHAAGIAHRVHILKDQAPVPALKSVGRLGGLVLDLLKDSLDAYANRDTDRAVRVWERDEDVDALYSSLFRELLTYMMEDPRNIAPCSHLLFVAKNLERIGDHATTVAEVTHYIATGQRLGRARPKGDTTTKLDVSGAGEG